MKKEIEIIVKDKGDFKILKKHANYASELTGVMTFDESVLLKGLSPIEKYVDKDVISKARIVNYTIDYDKYKRKIVMNCPASYIEFCNGFIYKDNQEVGYVHIDNLKYVYILLKYGLINPTDNFKELFSPLEKNCLLTDLHAFHNREQFRKNDKWSFVTFLQEVEEKALKKDSDKTEKAKEIVSKMRVEDSGIFNVKQKGKKSMFEVRCLIHDVNKKVNKAMCEDIENQAIRYEIKRYGWAPFKSKIWEKGNEVRLLVDKKYRSKDGLYSIVNPIILPSDIEIKDIDEFSMDLGSLVNRKFLTSMYNRLYFEYKIRTECINKA